MSPSAVTFGCAGPRLTSEEAAFFREVQPWGFILFRRNVETPAQVRALVDDLRETISEGTAPVLVDQEGGRVQRFAPPHWPKYPPGRAYGETPGGPAEQTELARLGARLIARDLAGVGVDVDCAPVLDVPAPEAHDVVGDRAYGAAPEVVAALGRAFAEGLMSGGVLPVIKHMPGHGRARSDSHEQLPVVDAPLSALQRDFAPFRDLADLPMAMTAHVVFAAIDAERPATQSKTVIDRIIRGEIGFEGLLMSDDLSMKALAGDLQSRAAATLAAGCDVVLHCNGDMGEMRAVAAGACRLSGEAERRAVAALARRRPREPLDVATARARFAAAFEGLWVA